MTHLRLFWLLWLFVLPSLSQAQRGGRADSAQNYSHRNKPFDPIITLRLNDQWTYRRLSLIRSLQRITLNGRDSTSGAEVCYQGAPLDQLLPARHLMLSFEVYRETHFWFRDRLAFSSISLDPESQLIIADTKNNLSIQGSNPFTLVVKGSDGILRVVKEIAYVRIRYIP